MLRYQVRIYKAHQLSTFVLSQSLTALQMQLIHQALVKMGFTCYAQHVCTYYTTEIQLGVYFQHPALVVREFLTDLNYHTSQLLLLFSTLLCSVTSDVPGKQRPTMTASRTMINVLNSVTVHTSEVLAVWVLMPSRPIAGHCDLSS